MSAELDTEGMSRVRARALEHLADPVQLHMSERHWGTGNE